MRTSTVIEPVAPRTLSEADLKPRGRVFPSPAVWRDQVLYQLLPDRFSDGREGERAMFDFNQPGQFRAPDKAAWMAAGTRFNGGTIEGIASKLDYLQGLGVTTLWINPPWRQRADLETYHGYGIQHFLDIDPRFGTRQELRDLVDAAHDRGMYVLLDVIYNHSGNNWFYRDEQTGAPRDTQAYRFAPPYPIHGWRSATGESISTPVTEDDGVWPVEFQNPAFYTRSGSIGQWGLAGWEDPMNAKVEFRRGDFYDLKDFDLDSSEQAIRALVSVYQYWIALTDCDGFRVDAVKHVSVEASRKFCTAIHEYAQSIGKDNFFLTGEITDSNIAPGYVDFFGRNLDAVLGITLYPNVLGAFAKGLVDPRQFFQLYDESYYGAMRQLGKFIVHVLDDHDMAARPQKQRFAAHGALPNVHRQAALVAGIQLTTPGIPAIYYGTEQAFDGNEGYHDYGVEAQRFAEDRYVREAMFGGAYGAFGTTGCHFFNPNHPTYLRIAAIARLRNGKDRIGRTLCRGHLYPRETAVAGAPFQVAGQGEVTAWSQILFVNEVLVVINTHGRERRSAEVTVDAALHPEGSTMKVRYHSDWSDEELRNPPGDHTVTVQRQPDGRATVFVELESAGMAILV